MLVSHRYRFIYLKTRKTAGSSIELAFEPYARPEGWTPPDGDPAFATEEMVSEAGIVGARSPEPKERATYIDHMQADQVRRRVPREVWRNYFKFCAIRNPWDKAVSFFHFAHKKVKDEDPDEVVKRFRRWVANGQQTRTRDKAIYWIAGRPVVDGYIRYHHLEEDAHAIASHLGIETLEIGGIHSGFRPDKLHYTAYYDDGAREAVAETFADEIAHFGWTFDNSSEIEVPEIGGKVGLLSRLTARVARPEGARRAGGRRLKIAGAAGKGPSQTNE